MKHPDGLNCDKTVSRRDAMIRLARGTLTAALAGSVATTEAADPTGAEPPEKPSRDLVFFSKPFQSLSFDQLGEMAAQAGYTGLELPVRPGGHIQPEAVQDELPKAVEAFRKHGLTIPLISTGINEVSDAQSTERVLRTAVALGIPRFRMAYYRYDLRRPVAEQLKSFSPKLNDLIAMAAELRIKPLYQNHSGSRYVGAGIWDIYWLLQKHSPEEVGLTFDIGHAIIEGSKCWPLHVALVRDYLDVAYIKDPIWNVQQKQFQWAPLGKGCITHEYFEMLARSGFDGPMSIHVEYFDHNDAANQNHFRAAFRDDLATLRGYVG